MWLVIFVASALVSFYGVGWARKYRAHPKVITVASIIPMIPGTFAYNTMISIVAIASGQFTDQTLGAVAENGLKTLFILGGIAFGLTLPGILIYRKKPIV
ncbi:threonine/serine exporter family protein [uncultured Desulfobacter sp.]|uniref:threonine/serine exporter family protein n=1 Tax=uncultured Desulfobacter sp. TaxID=240139 RepID=UPI0029F53804|nr:threonine/serine exporter family protein [uncultured Desulfobacter sp.]